MAADPSRLARVFHHRWSVPVLAVLAERSGGRVVELTHAVGAGRQPVRDALEALVELGLVQPNPGYGHPMRPEYVLTGRGERVGPACVRLMGALREAEAMEVGLRKWSMATVAAVAEGPARFGQIAGALGRATDRAVSLALGDLTGAGLVQRVVMGAPPYATVYGLTARGAPVAEPLGSIGGAVEGA